MDFDEVILAHTRWKSRLKESIAGNGTIDANTAGRDDQCEFGKWVLGEGKKYSNSPAFAELKAKHTQFHLQVAQVVKQAKVLPKEKALELLDPLKSDFGRASVACINAIAKLKQSIS